MFANFNFEIQSEYFGNRRSLSIKGCMIDIVDQYFNGYMEFHSHFSDDSRQDASTTHAHMISILTEVRNNNQLKQRCTILESTDRYCKQYRCGAALFFKSMISTNFNIIVDRMIGAPGHEKDVVDGINACDKIYLMRKYV